MSAVYLVVTRPDAQRLLCSVTLHCREEIHRRQFKHPRRRLVAQQRVRLTRPGLTESETDC